MGLVAETSIVVEESVVSKAYWPIAVLLELEFAYTDVLILVAGGLRLKVLEAWAAVEVAIAVDFAVVDVAPAVENELKKY